MTAVFTHFWFSKWIFPSWHYWSESQYNECLRWRWHRGGLILPQNELVLKYSTFCPIDPLFGMSACMYICKHFKRLSSNKSWVEAVVSNLCICAIYSAVSLESHRGSYKCTIKGNISASSAKDTYKAYFSASWFLQCGSCGLGNISKPILDILLTSLHTGHCCWLFSAVSAALKHPPHVILILSPSHLVILLN